MTQVRMGQYGGKTPQYSSINHGPFSPSVTKGGNDVNSILLANFNGTQSAKTFSDSSQYNIGLTGNGSAHISTTASKLGTSSLRLDGLGGTQFTATCSLVSAKDSATWSRATASFTIDAWVRTDGSVGGPLLGQISDTTNFWVFTAGPNSMAFASITAGVWNVNIGTTGNPLSSSIAGDWNHYAVVRDSYATGSTWFLFCNGISQPWTVSTGNVNGTISDLASNLLIGTLFGNYTPAVACYISGLRFSNIVRWRANFDPQKDLYR